MAGSIRSLLAAFVFLAAPWLGVGCGYSFQNSKNPLFEQYGVRRIYVEPLHNDSYKPGIENVVYNELLRVIAANRRVTLVSSPAIADAVLGGRIAEAGYYRAGGSSAGGLFPLGTGKHAHVPSPPKSIVIATEYSARLDCSFQLKLVGSPSRPGKTLWTSGFARSKNFPANNQVGSFGTTSSLINESEFDRALGEMARNMMADVHESMLAMF